jgi:F0F1-type ATP synthase membrane subunit b/b'
MLINFTLVIQAFNFYIAYLIIKRWIVNPCLAAIEQEDFYHARLIADINQQHALLASKHHEIEEQWRQCQYFFSMHAPQAYQPRRLSIQTTLALIPISSEQLNKRATALQQEINKWVRHVRP